MRILIGLAFLAFLIPSQKTTGPMIEILPWPWGDVSKSYFTIYAGSEGEVEMSVTWVKWPGRKPSDKDILVQVSQKSYITAAVKSIGFPAGEYVFNVTARDSRGRTSQRSVTFNLAGAAGQLVILPLSDVPPVSERNMVGIVGGYIILAKK
jgi:hypothetical protein